MSVQARIVSAVEQLDTLLDRIPSVEFAITERGELGRYAVAARLYARGEWGCRLGLASVSDRLDQRWNTGVWKAVKPFRVKYLASDLSFGEEARVREEIDDVSIDRNTDPSKIFISWIERAVDARAALAEAREIIKLTGINPRLGAFAYPKEITE